MQQVPLVRQAGQRPGAVGPLPQDGVMRNIPPAVSDPRLVSSVHGEPAAVELKVDRRLRPGRKEEILHGVLGLLAEGNRKITTALLAQRVGLSEAALYRHYPNKTAIFQALAGHLEEQLLFPPSPEWAALASPLGQLRGLFKHCLRVLTEQPGLSRVYLVEGIAVEAGDAAARMIQGVAKHQTQIRQLLRKAQTAGEISPDLSPEQGARLMVGMLQARALAYLLGGFQERPDADWKGAWKLFRSAIRGGG